MTFGCEDINIRWSLSRFSALTAASAQFTQKIIELEAAAYCCSQCFYIPESHAGKWWRGEPCTTLLRLERAGQVTRRDFGPGLVVGWVVGLGGFCPRWQAAPNTSHLTGNTSCSRDRTSMQRAKEDWSYLSFSSNKWGQMRDYSKKLDYCVF